MDEILKVIGQTISAMMAAALLGGLVGIAVVSCRAVVRAFA